MANKPLKSIKFPGLTDTYTIPQIDTSLTVGGKAADAQAVGNKFTEVFATAGKAFPTDTLSGDIVTFADGADDVPMKSVVVNIEPVQSGSGDPSPDNVRPISGWTGAQVVRAGVNVWDEEWLNGYYSPTTGAYVSDSRYICSKNLIAVKPSETYYIFTSAEEMEICEYNASGTFLRQPRSGAKNEAVTISADTYYINISTHVANVITAYDPSVKPISVNYPPTDHDYHPYAGDTYSITFPSEAGTVYGGVLDVTNGTLTVDRAMVDLGTLTWAKDSTAPFFYSVTPPLFGNNGTAKLGTPQPPFSICEMYKNGPVNSADTINGNFMVANSTQLPILRVSDDRFSDGTSFKAAVDGVKSVVILKSPITYTLTPTEIKSLLGDNNVWADAGDTTVTYRADTKLYIDKKIAEIVSALS